jgi:hypothetical protein
MVSMTRKKLVLLFAAFFLNTAFLSSIEVSVTRLVQYGENIDRERLELLADHQTVQFPDFNSYQITGTYTIRNTGGEYQATLGLFFDPVPYAYTEPALTGADLRYLVDGKQVPFTEILVPRIRESTGAEWSASWALIDILFPANGVLTVQVQYKRDFVTTDIGNTVFAIYGDRPFYLLYLSAEENWDYWKGTPDFSLEVINDFIRQNGFFWQTFENQWVADIKFSHIEDADKNIDMSKYLQSLQGLETELMQIRRLSGNSFRIDFTEEFAKNYQRSFGIFIRGWSAEVGSYLSYRGTGMVLAFLDRDSANISQRELAPYELVFLTNSQLRLVRNAFYARHGFIFKSQNLREAFDFLWSFGLPFDPDIPFDESMLTDAERANIAVIQRLEAMLGN